MHIDTIIFVNNAISSRLAWAVIQKESIDPATIALFSLRKTPDKWRDFCAEVIDNDPNRELSVIRHRRFVDFYRRASGRIRQLLSSGDIRRIVLVNNDNLLTAHVLAWAEGRTDVHVSVLAEGIMNFQDIARGNRESWRWTAKPFAAAALGLKWREPRGHLSGAFDPVVKRVYSFSADGLKAPTEKIEIIPLEKTKPHVVPARDTVLLVHTGLWQWMKPAENILLSHAFINWLNAQGYAHLLTKSHPHVAAGPLEELLPHHTPLNDARSLEDMAADIPAATVVGTCCTGLVTLKLMRPDLECIDFGADFYCEKAYRGDHSVEVLMRASGVRMVNMVDDRSQN